MTIANIPSWWKKMDRQKAIFLLVQVVIIVYPLGLLISILNERPHTGWEEVGHVIILTLCNEHYMQAS